jgi:uncharacterized phage protein (TIGR02218 family)
VTLSTLARCMTVELRDGTVIGMSDHDAPLSVEVPGLGPVIQRPNAGLVIGDVQISVTLDSGNTDVTCPLSAYVGRTQVVGRRFNHALVWAFEADWSLAVPVISTEIMKGLIAEARVEEAVAVFEVRDNNDFWNVSIGSVLTPRCRADFGDALCGKTREEVAATITAVESSMVFTTSLGGAYPSEHFRFGDCVFTSGGLDGVWPIEIVAFDGATGEVELLVPLPEAPEVGDELVLHDGCSRLKVSTDATIPTCFTHANVPRFRGFDQVPGSDTFIKVAAPGGG